MVGPAELAADVAEIGRDLPLSLASESDVGSEPCWELCLELFSEPAWEPLRLREPLLLVLRKVRRPPCAGGLSRSAGLTERCCLEAAEAVVSTETGTVFGSEGLRGTLYAPNFWPGFFKAGFGFGLGCAGCMLPLLRLVCKSATVTVSYK